MCEVLLVVKLLALFLSKSSLRTAYSVCLIADIDEGSTGKSASLVSFLIADPERDRWKVFENRFVLRSYPAFGLWRGFRSGHRH